MIVHYFGEWNKSKTTESAQRKALGAIQAAEAVATEPAGKYSNLRNEGLKETLRARGLPVSGNRTIMIQRLEAYDMPCVEALEPQAAELASVQLDDDNESTANDLEDGEIVDLAEDDYDFEMSDDLQVDDGADDN